MLAGLFKTSPSKSPGSPTRSTKQASRSVYHHGYAPSASAGLTLASRPRPIEVAASVALSPAGPSRSRGLSQWAIELSSPPRVADACEDGGKPPEPVPSSEKRPAASHGRMVEGLAMLANSDRLMPWVRHMEIGPGRFYTGFLDEQGLPDIFGFIQYFGHDIGAALDASEHVFGLHVRAHFESRSSLDGRNFIQTARHDVRAVSSLPSVVTHVVHRPAASTQGSLAVYIGEMRQGRRHGLGRIKFHSGNEYAGTWNHDQPQGVGVERRADRSRHYGHFSRWQCHGYGLAIEGQNEGPGFRTTEGLFADGKVDICAVGGRMQTERFLISRDEFWTRHRSDAFDPGNDRHIDLVRAVDSVFQKALEAERGANVMANLTLHLDQTCARLAKPALHQPGLGAGPGMREGDLDDRVQNFCSRSFDESAALKLSWSDLLAASAYTELVFGSLLSQLCRVAGDFAATGPGSCSRAVGLEAVSWASKNSDQSNAAVHLFLHEKFEVLSSTQPLLLAFERQLCRELATALAVSLDRLTILASNPSTTAPPAVTVVLLILSDTSGPTPAAIANRLQAQVSSADSCLKTGTYTRNLFRCKDLGCTSHRDGAPPPYERAYQVQPGHFPWHSTPHSDQDNFPIYDISTISTFHRQPSDGESAFRGSSSSFTPSKYEFRPRSAFGRSISNSTFSEVESPPKSIMSPGLPSPRKSVKIAEEDPFVANLNGDDHQSWAEKAHKRLSPVGRGVSQASQEEASLLLSIENKRQALKRILAGGKGASDETSSKAPYLPVTPLQSPLPRPGNERKEYEPDAWNLERDSGETAGKHSDRESGGNLQISFDRMPRVSSSTSISSGSSRRQHQATPDALELNGGFAVKIGNS